MYIKSNNIFEDSDMPIKYEHTDNYWPNLKPLYLIIHYTAGTNLSSVINHFKTKYKKGNASAHVVIDRDGTVVQMVKFNRKAWHAGRSHWGELVGLNNYSIGIELVNAGRLEKTEIGEWFNWSGKKIADSEVVLKAHKHDTLGTLNGWHRYTPIQIEKLIEVSNALHDKYGFIDILGHDDVSPGRKIDPGPAFNMISFRSMILGR